MSAFRTGTVTLADTGEDVPALSILGNCHCSTGWDWIEDIDGHGWGAIGAWGHDGFDLGDWPYVIVAATSVKDHTGALVYGVAQYVEGDVDCRYYRAKPEAFKAITSHAFGTWKLLGNGPKELPATAQELPAELAEPCRMQTRSTTTGRPHPGAAPGPEIPGRKEHSSMSLMCAGNVIADARSRPRPQRHRSSGNGVRV